MSVSLTGSGGLFTILGKIFYAQQTLNTAIGTTVEGEVVDVVTALEALSNTVDHAALSDGIQAALNSWQSNTSLHSKMSSIAKQLIITLINEDNPLPNRELTDSTAELILQMIGAGTEFAPDDSVDANVVGVSVSTNAGNEGDYVVAASSLNGKGRSNEHIFQETIEVTVSSASALLAEGEAAAPSFLSHDWPAGSGCNTTIPPVAAGSGALLSNGGMDDEDSDVTDLPDGWIASPATLSTTLKLTSYEVQQIVIASDPASGWYDLEFTNADGDVQTTAPLAWNATESQVQAAIRALAGYELVEVATSGTSPNYTHVITYTEVYPPGNQGQVVANSHLNTGTITPSTTTAGSANVYLGRAAEFDSNGSELTAIYQRMSGLAARTPYCFCGRFFVDVYPAAGMLAVDLVDGIDGNVIQNEKGNYNSILIDPTNGGDLDTAGWVAITGMFHLPDPVPDIVYFRVRIAIAVSSGSSIFIDELKLVAATELYQGGVYAAAFAGRADIGLEDRWTITATNDRGGQHQDWFLRNGLVSIGQMLPSDSGGTETISDTTLIS